MRSRVAAVSIGGVSDASEGRAPADRRVDRLDPVLAERWFQGLYDNPLLFSGILDREGRVLAANTLSVEGCGLDRSEVLGRPFWECGWWSPDPAIAAQIRDWCVETVRTGEPLRTRSRFFLGNGDQHWVDLALFPARSEGEITHIVATGNDITEAMLAQERELALVRDAERLTAHRLDQLSVIALRLADAEAMSELERVVTGPGRRVLGAAGAVLAVRDDEIGVVRLAVADRATTQEASVGYAELPMTSELPAAYVARTGEPLLFRSRAEGLSWSEATRVLYDVTDRAAWATLPLRVGERLVGALGLSWSSDRDFGEDELGLLRGFAAQCAEAVDRVRRHEASRAAASSARLMSTMLQRSSLTQPATPDTLEIAVRYQPAEEAAHIGGDWYDAFVDSSGATLLSVGDVNGHDQTAAATMGQVRNLLRGLSFDADDGPARLLTRLDSALRGLQLDTLATAVVVRVEQVPSPKGGGGCQLVWSSAGHLPPLLLRRDGSVTRLESEADLLLGVAPEMSRSEHAVDLEPGSTLLLYTDGLVERRDEGLDAGIDGLASELSDLGHLGLEQLCDALIESAAIGGAGDDDIALLVLRCRVQEDRNPGVPVNRRSR